MHPRFPLVVALTVLAVSAAPSTAFANIYTPRGAGSTLAPLKSEDIVMESERVLVEQGAGEESEHRASATYVMRNDSDRAIATRIAFPFRERNHTAFGHGNFRVILVAADGTETEPTCEKVLPDQIEKTPYDFGAAYVWDVTWAPRETKTIKVSYTVGEMRIVELFIEGWRLAYIVSTGAFWKGPIGAAEFTFRFASSAHAIPLSLESAFTDGADPDVIHPGYSYPDRARRISPTEIQWRFENWIPNEDVWVGHIRWVGLDGYGLHNVFFPGPDYRGAEIAYDDAFLEEKVAFLLENQRSRFPEQTRTFHPRFKAFYAKVLYHEILARNGDGFYLGKKGDGQPDPPDHYASEVGGNRISIWREQFMLGSRFRDWYQPGTGKGPHGSVRLEDLTPLERRNLAFLLTCFDPAEAHPAKK